MGLIGIHGSQIEAFLNSGYQTAILATEDNNAHGEALKTMFREISNRKEYKDILFYHVRIANIAVTGSKSAVIPTPLLVVADGKDFFQQHQAIRTEAEIIDALDYFINPQDYLVIPAEDIISIEHNNASGDMCNCHECCQRRVTLPGYGFN